MQQHLRVCMSIYNTHQNSPQLKQDLLEVGSKNKFKFLII